MARDRMMLDYIIIGAGSAGCALTYELVRSGRSVLVLEAGGSDRSAFIKIPACVFQAIARHDWGYQAQPDPSRNGARDRWFRGRVVGGSSSINGTVYVRGAAQDFDRWSKHCGHRGEWSAGDVMPIFRSLESSDQSGSWRGHGGPLHVRTVRRPHATTRAFVQSVCAAGYPFNEDYNDESQEGVAYLQLSQRRGLRCSAADAFLRPLQGRRNLKLLLNAAVQKIEMADGRAEAVSFSHRGRLRREMARNVILCAGAIDSPKLLMLSGIGEPAELRRHDIETALDLPAIGRHLKDHPLLPLTFRTKVPTYNLTEGLRQKLGIAAKFLMYREGPVSSLFESTAFIRSSASEAAPDIQLVFYALAFVKTPTGDLKRAPYPAVTVSLSKSYPVSSGRIRLASSNPKAPPLIECSLLGEQADVDTLVRGIQTIRKIMKMAPIADLIEEEVTPGVHVESPAALEAFVRAHTGIRYHTIGTCRMGIDADAVVGPDLRVHGTENLWVADASIMPDHLSANTNSPCMMIGAKLGRQLCRGLGGRGDEWC